MKIAHIAPPWIAIPPKHYGGTENVIYNLIEEQVAQGYEVTLFAPGDAKTSARLVSFFPQSLIDTGAPWAAHLQAYYHMYKSIEYIKDHEFDLLHTHLSSAADMYIFPLAANLTIPHLVTLHSRFPFDRVGTWTGNADQLYMEWVASVPMVAISVAARDEVPYDLNFVGVVHHGLPMNTFQPLQESPEEYFVWLGRIVPEKGAHLAIEAAKRADVPLVMAGIVDQHLPEAVAYFENQIQPQIDQQRIKFIGPVNLEQKIDLLRRARGLLNPIEWEEPFGMVMIEAMALGCPVITFPRGAAPEIVVHRKSGFLAHNVEEMAHLMTKIDMLDRAVVRAHVEQHYSAKVMAEKYSSIYKKVIVAHYLAESVSPPPTNPRKPATALKRDESAVALYPSFPTTTLNKEVKPAP
jgi:glycosyltransferase involved in cell wall biosynthesis